MEDARKFWKSCVIQISFRIRCAFWLDGREWQRIKTISACRRLAMRKRRMLTLGGAMLAVLVLSACDSGSIESELSQDLKVYRHVIDGAPSSLDPAQANSTYARLLVPAIFDTLYRYRYLKRPYTLAPSLAVDFPVVSDDGLTYDITLRSDAYFADSPFFESGRGRRVTAQDVAWSIARHFDPETRSGAVWLWRDRIVGLDFGQPVSPDTMDIDGLEVLDDTRLRIHLREPFPTLIHTLATAQSAIVPHEVVEALGAGFGRAPVGSGPFRLVEFNETQATLIKNDGFDRGVVDLAAEGFDPELHGGLGLASIDGRRYPFVDRLEVQFISEASARWNSFRARSGTDLVMVPPELATSVLSSSQPIGFSKDVDERYHTLAAPEAGFAYYGLNFAHPALGRGEDPGRAHRNRELRCALGQAIDWSARNQRFYHGIGDRIAGVIPPFLPAWAPSTPTPYSAQDARRRWSEAGWSDATLPELVYGHQSGVQQAQHFEMFRANLMAAGYPAERIKQRVFPTFAELLRGIHAGEVDVFLMGWTMAYPDALYNLQLFYGPNAPPGVNASRYDNPRFDALFERARRQTDRERRLDLYGQLNQILIEDCVILGAMVRTRLLLWKRHLRMLPDREMVGGFFLPFVDVRTDDEQ
jgi:ABC-type transport system substrate-binding protein